MLSSRKWNDGRHWRRFAALFSCSFLIICFLIHKAKGESSMLLKPEIEQNGTSIEGVLYTPNGEGPFPTVILTHGFTGNYTYITGNIAKELANAGFAAYAFNLRNPDTRSMLNTSVLTEAATLDTVIDQIKALDYAAMVKNSKYTANKELMIIPGAVHTDLYDKVDIIPFDKLEYFFKEYLK